MTSLIDHMMVNGGWISVVIFCDAWLLYTLLVERCLHLWHPSTRAQALACSPADSQFLQHELTRSLSFIRALIAIAPLLGLLGTVNGMISTFDQLTHGLGRASLGSVIAAALVTTQFGLLVAAPALVMERLLNRRAAQLTTQHLQRHALNQTGAC